MTNKAGFTEEQQQELQQLIAIATLVARCVTEQTVGTIKDEAAATMELFTYIRETYPKGPMHLKRSLDNIIRFCDLDTIIVVSGPDAPP
jgi:hypothetical protein